MIASRKHGSRSKLLLAMIGAIVALAIVPSAAFGAASLALKLGSTENYQFKPGDTVVADTAGLSNDKYTLTVTEPDGSTTHTLATCSSKPTGQNPGGTYSLTGASPTTTADWTVTELVYASPDSTCSTVPTTLTKTFDVAQATNYTDLDVPTTATLGPSSTAHVGVAGLKQSQTWSVKWIAPNSATPQCQNTTGTGGTDRPTSDASGVLPTTGRLQYQPGLVGDPWNLQSNYDGACPAFGAANSGNWTLRLEADATHFVDLPAFTLDGVPPTPTATTPANNSFINNNTPSLGGAIGTASGDIAAVTVGLYNGTDTSVAAIQTPVGNVSSPNWSTDPVSTLTDGQYTAKVSQSDSVGNSGSATSTFTVDTQNPTVAYTLTPSSPDGQNGWFITKPTVHVVATDANIDTLSCTRNGLPVTLTITPTSTTRSADVPLPNGAGNADGTNNISCTAQDKASNSHSEPTSFKLDTQDPTVQVTRTPGTANGLNNYYTSIQVDTSSHDAQSLTGLACTDALNGGAATPVTLTSTTATGTPVTDRTGTVPVSGDGNHTVSCTGTDEAGRTKTTNTSFLLDQHAPNVGLTDPADGAYTNNSTPTLDGGAGSVSGDQDPVTANIWSGTGTAGSPLQTFTPAGVSTGSWSAVAGTLADGTYTAQASQSDLAGNLGTSSAHTFVVDTTKPTASIALNPASPNGANGTYTSPPNVHVVGDDANISGFSCVVDGAGTAVTNLTGSGGHLEADVPVSGDGQHSVSCSAVDKAGNSSDPAGMSFTVATPVNAAASGFTGTIGSGGNGVLSALVTLAGKSKQNPLKQHNAVLVTVQCTTVPCVVSAGGTLSVPKLSKVYRFKTVSKTLTSTGKTTIKLLIPKKALKSLKKVIAKKKSAIAKIKVTAKAGGKSSTAQRTIVLKR